MKSPIKRSLAIAGALAIGACQTAPAGPDAPPPGAATVTAQEVLSIQNQWSGYEAATTQLITTPQAWATAWQVIHRDMAPQPPLPAVNFDSHVLLLAAMGQRSSGGHSIRITGVQAHNNVFYAAVTETAPGPNCMTTTVMTAPVHVVQVPRQGASATFNVTRTTQSC
jgi:hypothetical protein